jgi:hypothetical protein
METTYNYDVWNGNANDFTAGAIGAARFANEAVTYFTQPTKILHIWAVDNDLIIRFSFRRDVLEWNDGIVIRAASQSQDFYHSAQAWQVVNREIGATAWYQVLGMW